MQVTIPELNEDCWSSIFSYLPKSDVLDDNLFKIDKLTQKAAIREFRRRINCFEISLEKAGCKTKEVAFSLLNRCKFITSADLRPYNNLSDENFVQLADNRSDLTGLALPYLMDLRPLIKFTKLKRLHVDLLGVGGQCVNGDVIFNLSHLEQLDIRNIISLNTDINKLTKLKKLCIIVRGDSCLLPIEEKTINALESCFLKNVKLPNKSSSLVSIGDYLISPTEEQLLQLLAELIDAAYLEYNFLLSILNEEPRIVARSNMNEEALSKAELIVKVNEVLEGMHIEPTLAAQNIREVLALLSKKD